MSCRWRWFNLRTGKKWECRKGRETSRTGKQAGEEEGLCQKLFSIWNSREKGRKILPTPISVCTVCSCNPPVGFTLCSSHHGGSFVLIIGWKLQKLCLQSQCLVLTEVSGSGSPGHGSPKESLQRKSFTICILAMVFWRFPMDDLVIPIKKTPCNSLQSLKKNQYRHLWLLIIHWHCLLPNNNIAWIADPAPSMPQPGRQKGKINSVKSHMRMVCVTAKKRSQWPPPENLVSATSYRRG